MHAEPLTAGRETGRRKLGIIAGGGELPLTLAERCAASGRPYFVVRLRGFAGAELRQHPGADLGLAELGHCFAALRAAGCEAVCFAGQVDRPDLTKLKPDLRGLRALPAALSAARRGDDALLRFLVVEFEGEGFVVEGAEAVDAALTLAPGALGTCAPALEHQADLALAVRTARSIGALDIGQAAVVAGGLVLAVEAQEGTDALLLRCAGLPAALRGEAGARRGVLAKWPKPIQERRVDLPTIGARTVELAAAAGLAGIAGEAGALLLLDTSALRAAADRLGLFVWGVAPE